MSKGEWRSLEELREIQEDICNLPYTADFIKEHEISFDTYDQEIVQTWQPCEIKKGSDGKIYWRQGELQHRKNYREKPSRVQTSMGVFVNDNFGEFGGNLVTPFKKRVHGNYEEIFEWNGNVYAVESLNHFGPCHCGVVEFHQDGSYEYLFAYGWDAKWKNAMVSDEEPRLEVEAWYITDEALYFLCGGHRKPDADTFFAERRLIKVTPNKAEETDVFDFCIGEVSSMIVEDTVLYIGINKELLVVNRESKDIKRYTFLSEEECAALKEGDKHMLKLMGF